MVIASSRTKFTDLLYVIYNVILALMENIMLSSAFLEIGSFFWQKKKSMKSKLNALKTLKSTQERGVFGKYEYHFWGQ